MAKKRAKPRKKASSRRSSTTTATSKEPFDVERYEELRCALREHQREWERAARHFPDLSFQLFFSPTGELSEEAWSGFADYVASSNSGEWYEWADYEPGIACGRFSGDPYWFQIFKQMAQATSHILVEDFHPTLSSQVDLPDGIVFRVGYLEGYLAWIDLVFDTAKVATPMLHWIGRFWNAPDGLSGVEVDELCNNSWGMTENGVRFPNHPHFISLPHNLFRCSAEAIRYWLKPDGVPIIGQLLAESPIRLPTQTQSSAQIQAPTDSPLWKRTRRQAFPKMRPRYDKRLRKLFLDDWVIKTFSQSIDSKQPRHQELIFQGFEEIAWQHRQDNPISHADDPDFPKTSQEQMERAVRDFNRREDDKYLQEVRTGTQSKHILRLDYERDAVTWFLMDTE